jgi:[acyl-carrier-protein] S-malonyltransferase
VKTAFLFPGQGAHQLAMLDDLERLPAGKHYLELANEIAALDIATEARRRGQSYLAKNEIASLVTAAFSLAAGHALEDAGIEAMAYGGYSVGQWTAMCAAGMVTQKGMLCIVYSRAQCMNAASEFNDGMMLAIIGLPVEAVEAVCRKVSAEGESVAISNYNAIGQFTIAGQRHRVEWARKELSALSPRQLLPINVSGAWHCAMMSPAAVAFAPYLERVSLRAPPLPVVDNVTGDLLPHDPDALAQTLTRHLDHPVRWDQCIRRLIALGVERFVEVGFGNMLTKFGVFIDRSCEFVTYDRLLRAPQRGYGTSGSCAG